VCCFASITLLIISMNFLCSSSILDIPTLYLSSHADNSIEITEILNEMNKYVLTHFANEETYMIKCNYPEYDDHRKKHQDFSIKIMAFLDSVTKGDCRLACELLEHLKNWLVNHIQGTDRKYINCFKEHGLR